MRKELVFGLFLLLVCLGSAQAYQLAYKDPAGAARWYQNDVTLKGSFLIQPMNQTIPIEGVVKFITSEKVAGVNDNGTSTVVTELGHGNITMTIPGADQPMVMPFPAFKMTSNRAPSGKTSDIKIEGQPGGLGALPGMEDQLKMFNSAGQFEFPAGDLKAGDTWENTQSFEFTPGQKIDMKITNVLKGTQVVDGVTYLLINSEMKMEMPSMKIQVTQDGQTITMEEKISLTGKVATLFDEQAGEMNRALMNMAMEMTMTMPIPNSDQTMVMQGTMTMAGSTTKIQEPAVEK